MSQTFFAFLAMVVLLTACAARVDQGDLASRRDWMQDDMIAHPERYIPIPPQSRGGGGQQQAVPVSRTAMSKPVYCPSGSLAAEMAPSFVEGLELLKAQCRPGDSLVLRSQNTGLIASACDLNKPVSSAGGNVFCTMGTIREMRR